MQVRKESTWRAKNIGNRIFVFSTLNSLVSVAALSFPSVSSLSEIKVMVVWRFQGKLCKFETNLLRESRTLRFENNSFFYNPWIFINALGSLSISYLLEPIAIVLLRSVSRMNKWHCCRSPGKSHQHPHSLLQINQSNRIISPQGQTNWRGSPASSLQNSPALPALEYLSSPPPLLPSFPFFLQQPPQPQHW